MDKVLLDGGISTPEKPSEVDPSRKTVFSMVLGLKPIDGFAKTNPLRNYYLELGQGIANDYTEIIDKGFEVLSKHIPELRQICVLESREDRVACPAYIKAEIYPVTLGPALRKTQVVSGRRQPEENEIDPQSNLGKALLAKRKPGDQFFVETESGEQLWVLVKVVEKKEEAKSKGKKGKDDGSIKKGDKVTLSFQQVSFTPHSLQQKEWVCLEKKQVKKEQKKDQKKKSFSLNPDQVPVPKTALELVEESPIFQVIKGHRNGETVVLKEAEGVLAIKLIEVWRLDWLGKAGLHSKVQATIHPVKFEDNAVESQFFLAPKEKKRKTRKTKKETEANSAEAPEKTELIQAKGETNHIFRELLGRELGEDFPFFSGNNTEWWVIADISPRPEDPEEIIVVKEHSAVTVKRRKVSLGEMIEERSFTIVREQYQNSDLHRISENDPMPKAVKGKFPGEFGILQEQGNCLAVKVNFCQKVFFKPFTAQTLNNVVRRLIRLTQRETDTDTQITGLTNEQYKTVQGLALKTRQGFGTLEELSRLGSNLTSSTGMHLASHLSSFFSNELDGKNPSFPRPRAVQATKKEYEAGLREIMTAVSTPRIAGAKEKIMRKIGNPYPVAMSQKAEAGLFWFNPIKPALVNKKMICQPGPLMSLFKPKIGEIFLVCQILSSGYAESLECKTIKELDPEFSASLAPCQGMESVGNTGLLEQRNHLKERNMVFAWPVLASKEYRGLLLPEEFITSRGKKFHQQKLQGLPFVLAAPEINFFKMKVSLPIEVFTAEAMTEKTYLGLAPNVKGEWVAALVNEDGKVIKIKIFSRAQEMLKKHQEATGNLQRLQEERPHKKETRGWNKNLQGILIKEVVEPVIELAGQYRSQIGLCSIPRDIRTERQAWNQMISLSAHGQIKIFLQTKVQILGLPEIKEDVVSYFDMAKVCSFCGAEQKKDDDEQKVRWNLFQNKFYCAICAKKGRKNFQSLALNVAVNTARLLTKK